MRTDVAKSRMCSGSGSGRMIRDSNQGGIVATLIVDQGDTIAEAIRSTLGVRSTALRWWVHQLQGEHCSVTPIAQALTPEAA